MTTDLNASRRFLLRAASAVAALSLSPAWIRQARAQKQGGTLTVALSNNPITCDPINMVSHDSEILSQTIWETLVEYDIDGVLKPQLAKALPTISDDKLTYAFELHDNITFQNGQKLTAEDVKYSFEYTIDPAHKASRGSLFNRISHVEVDSPTKLRVILKEPYAPWLTFLTKFMGIWPAGSREKYGEDYFPPETRRHRHRAGHLRRVAPQRLRQLQAQPELLAARPAPLGIAWWSRWCRRIPPASPI